MAKLTRASEMNTLTLELLDELDKAVDEAFRHGARALIITGSGRAFCCGAHLRYFTDPESPIGVSSLSIRDNYLARIARLFDKLETMPFPVIAAINGFALGGGCELALSCDFRIMASQAIIGLPETRIGATPGAGGVQKLQRYVGRGKALEWILLGSHLGAEAAEDAGLLFARTEAEDLMPCALALARRVVSLAPNALAQAKMSLHVSGDVDLRTARRYGLEALSLLVGQAEWREGMTAFAEKRAPDFSGPGDWGR
ncbi:enoyl-CoA hydratase-related protein [Phenylobacterium sp. LH3H17]|uniref:enoyl-CoA hydratase/isomerase family protein n=1 Tax=Phenylobacterium sp. LH3H17 TaxID=2903901 RepID=UPI0020C9BC76|nr:enoyl-CoA hydratase-related protein [Phenylobacterium sp. LH3H17]UTP38285.1 enoyl-CoA hydratase-related protein [Phenylobacterium sp. LH3H17]